MKIAFVHDWEPDLEQELTWRDGLWAALKELERRGHIVHRVAASKDTPATVNDILLTPHVVETVQDWNPDVILHWADFTRPNAKPLKELGIPMAICFAGGNALGDNNVLFDHIFVESEVYKQELNEHGFDNVSIAFGTNTDLFRPIDNPKLFDTIFPATFAEWKRHNIYAQATDGLRSLAVGYIQPEKEAFTWRSCLEHGVSILPHVSAEALLYLYAASKIVVITARSNGGSQRTVLEAMAMNLPVIVTDSDKFDFAGERVYHCQPDADELRSYINALLDGEPDVNTRDYIVNNWSHNNYADELEAGLKNILSTHGK